MGGVSRYFSQVSGSGVDSTLLNTHTHTHTEVAAVKLAHVCIQNSENARERRIKKREGTKGGRPRQQEKRKRVHNDGQSWIRWQPHESKEKTGRRTHPTQPRSAPTGRREGGQARTTEHKKGKNLNARQRTKSRETDTVGKKKQFFWGKKTNADPKSKQNNSKTQRRQTKNTNPPGKN